MQPSEQLKQKAQELMGSRLKMRRMEMSLTQEEVGVNVGYSPMAAKQAISQIERGITWMPNKKQDDFIQALHLDRNLVTLASYHFFSQSYEEVIKMLNERQEAELRHRTQRLRINMSPPINRTQSPSLEEPAKEEPKPQNPVAVDENITFAETFVEGDSIEIPIAETSPGAPDPLTFFKTRLKGLIDAAEFMEKEQLIQALKKIVNE